MTLHGEACVGSCDVFFKMATVGPSGPRGVACRCWGRARWSCQGVTAAPGLPRQRHCRVAAPHGFTPRCWRRARWSCQGANEASALWRQQKRPGWFNSSRPGEIYFRVVPARAGLLLLPCVRGLELLGADHLLRVHEPVRQRGKRQLSKHAFYHQTCILCPNIFPSSIRGIFYAAHSSRGVLANQLLELYGTMWSVTKKLTAWKQCTLLSTPWPFK